MIRITNERWNGAQCPSTNDERPVDRALISLVKYELGYGGVITQLTKTKIVVNTRILNCSDIVTFEGSENDMRPLVEAASLYCQAAQTMRPAITEIVADKLNGQTALVLDHCSLDII